MDCKKCKEWMDVLESGWEDGMAIQVFECEICGLKAKGWWDLEPETANNISWSDEI